MGKVLKADCSAGDSYVVEAFGALGIAAPWKVLLDWYVPSSTFTALAADDGTADPVHLGNGSVPAFDGFFVTSDDTSGGSHPFSSGNRNYTTDNNPGNPAAGAFTSDVWHSLEVDHDGTNVTWKVDGVTVLSYSYPTMTPLKTLQVGGAESNVTSGEVYYLDNVQVYDSTDTLVFSDDFESGGTSAWGSTVGSGLSVVDDPSPSDTAAGFVVAFDDLPLADPVTWTRIDTQTGVNVTDITIDRGRTDERDKTNPGTVTVKGYDRAGVLDPTNTSGPFYGKIVPVKQAGVKIYNPVSADWHWLFRGYVDTWKYTLDPSEQFMEFEITLTDMLDLLNDAEIVPDEAGDSVPTESEGDCFYTGQHVDDRLLAVLADTGTAYLGKIWPTTLLQIASGNVFVQGRVYANRTSLLQVIDEACDAEFPGATNRFITKDGAFAFRGRYYRFVPAFYAASSDADRATGHELVHWDVGDVAAYKADSTVAVCNTLQFEIGKTDLINNALVTPVGITDAELASGSQFATDSTSTSDYGPRTSGMSLENLITGTADDGNTFLQETASFANVTVKNYKDPVSFVSELTFQSPAQGDATLAQRVWAILCGLELSDLVTVTSTHPGGGGFSSEDHYVESIKYELSPLQGDVWNVKQTVGLSSKKHFNYTDPSWNVPSVS